MLAGMAQAPAPVSSNPLRLLWQDVRGDRQAIVPFPPGATPRRSHRAAACQ
jgi:hypothetical protein